MNNQEIFNIIEHLRYFGVFIGAFFEGPATALIAGFLVKTSYLNFTLAFLVHAIGDFLADIVYFSIGYFSKGKMGRIKKFFKITDEKSDQMTKLLRTHPNKIIITGKLTHAFGLPVLISMGLHHYSFPKFLFFNLIATLIKSFAILYLGYYLADMWVQAENIFTYVGLFGIILLIIGVIYFLAKKTTKIENI